jgi:hypothetical protein
MRNKWDPESLRLDSSLVGRLKPKPRRMGKVRGAFLKGPIPVAWLGAAKKSGISALSVGLALWHILGKRSTFPVSNIELARWTDPGTFKRAIDMTDDELAAIVGRAKLTLVKSDT